MPHDTIFSTRVALALLCAAVAICTPTALDLTASPDEDLLSVRKGDASILVVEGSREVFAYRRGNVEFKPYVERLATPKGINILLDSPADHQHHHGLMLAIGADGVDFWSERHTDVPGAQRERTGDLLSHVDSRARELGLTQKLDWVDLGGGEKVVLTEERVVSVSVPEKSEVTLLSWTSRLNVPEGKDATKLWGRHYFGLGLRFVRSMDATGQFTNSSGEKGRVVRGDERLARATWCAYAAKVDDRPVTVAMFDHPKNPRHPATWFTMAKPFAYMTATLNLEAAPLTLRRGRPIRLRYAVALWDGRTDAAQIEKLYRKWAAR